MLNAYLLPHPPLIVPGVGRGDEIPATRASMRRVAAEIAAANPEVIVIISPHSTLYADYFHISPGIDTAGDFSQFGAGRLKYTANYDAELASTLAQLARDEGLQAGKEGERHPTLDHGVLVPLHFLREAGVTAPLVRLSLSGYSLLDHYRYGMVLQRAAKQLSRRMTIIASGDMSHRLSEDGSYGFDSAGPRHDAFVSECAASADFLRLLSIDPALSEAAAECGLRSLVILAGACDGMQVRGEVLSYEGPFGVGYLCASFIAEGEAPSLLPALDQARSERVAVLREREDVYVRLARENAEHYIRNRRSITLPDALPAEMLEQKAGVFVSIKKDGQLRGCIGTISSTSANIAEEILRNSVAASTQDPRFDPIVAEEIPHLVFSVDVLSPAEPISGPEQLDPSRYGVIVTLGRRRGLLLPRLEGVDTVAEQLRIVLQKASIYADEKYSLERFEVVRHEVESARS